jgi:histidine triad (HIT) family protein
MKDCIFCKIVKKEIPSKIIEESENFLAFPDINPQVKGHTLIITKEHYETFLDLPKNLGNELIEFTKKIAKKQMKENNATGFNLLNNNFKVAGQVVDHWHLHLLPRKESDQVKNLRI